MTYINAGAMVDRVRPKTKTALRKALADPAVRVSFDCTGLDKNGSIISGTAEAVGANKISVTGPDPYTARNWYATVEVKNGVLKVS